MMFFALNCKVVFPMKETAAGFCIMSFPTEKIADLIRYMHLQAFREAGLYISKDLTPFKADGHQQICQIMKGYWGIPTIPYAHFSCNLLKCTLKESGRPVQLSFAQVE